MIILRLYFLIYRLIYLALQAHTTLRPLLWCPFQYSKVRMHNIHGSCSRKTACRCGPGWPLSVICIVPFAHHCGNTSTSEYGTTCFLSRLLVHIGYPLGRKMPFQSSSVPAESFSQLFNCEVHITCWFFMIYTARKGCVCMCSEGALSVSMFVDTTAVWVNILWPYIILKWSVLPVHIVRD